MFGKKTKEARENLNTKNRNSYEKYKEDASGLIKEFDEQKRRYDSIISTINAERIRMRDELKKLYDFLHDIGKNFDKKLTPFNFVHEEVAPSSKLLTIDPLPEPETVEEHYFTDPILKTVNNNINNKNINDSYESNILQRELEYQEDLNKRENEIAVIKDACEIADLYKINICLLADAIRDSIIPELELINAFLYADAIRERIVDGVKVDGSVEPFDILEYKDTPQDIHFQFVRNTFDFYEICTHIYTEKILTNIINDMEITDDERLEFEKCINESKTAMNNVLEKKVS